MQVGVTAGCGRAQPAPSRQDCATGVIKNRSRWSKHGRSHRRRRERRTVQHEYAPKVRAWQPDWSTNRQYQTYTHHFALLSNWRPAYCSRWGHHKDARVVNGMAGDPSSRLHTFVLRAQFRHRHMSLLTRCPDSGSLVRNVACLQLWWCNLFYIFAVQASLVRRLNIM